LIILTFFKYAIYPMDDWNVIEHCHTMLQHSILYFVTN